MVSVSATYDAYLRARQVREAVLRAALVGPLTAAAIRPVNADGTLARLEVHDCGELGIDYGATS